MKKILILLIASLILLTGCDGSIISAYKDYHFDSYDGDLEVNKLVSNDIWSKRQDFASVVYNDEIYVIGGYDVTVRGKNDCYREDVYKSADGVDWTLLTDNAPFKGRRGHRAVVLGGSIYVAGGFYSDEETGARGYKNDVWKSNDGITWEEVSIDIPTPWVPRKDFGMISSNSGIYVFGGFRQLDGVGPQYLDDVWKFDGRSWTQLTDATMPGGRSAFAYELVGDEIYIQGGSFFGANQSRTGNVDSSVDYWDSLWKLDTKNDDAEWEHLKDSAPIESCNRRSDHSLVYFNNKLWLFSGRSNCSLTFSHNKQTYGTLYYEFNTDTDTDTVSGSWVMDSDGAPTDPLYGYSIEILNEKMYLLGGFSSSGPRNSVWLLEEGDN